MSTGVQGAWAIAVTEVSTNRQIIMRAGLSRGIVNFLLGVILVFPFLYEVFSCPGSGENSGDAPAATFMPRGPMRPFAVTFVFRHSHEEKNVSRHESQINGFVSL